jgi:DNA polymerase III subunit alpha
MEQPFVHLHTHSHYSLLDGMSKISDLVDKAKEFGMPALALTDHGAMYGAIEFYNECKKAGIKPIVGVEAYVANRTRFDKEPSIDNKRYHLTLLAKNNTGYRHLMKMVSKSYLEGFYYKPRIDKDLLREYAEGIICLSGCPGSEFIQNLRVGLKREARELIAFYIEIFSKEHVFIEVMKHDEVEWYAALVPEIKTIAAEFDLPIVATWDSHYLCADDKDAHNTLLKINTNNDTFKMDGDYSLISPKDAHKIFANTVPEAPENTMKVVNLVDLEIELSPWKFPIFPIPEGTTYDDELRREVLEGLTRKGMMYEGVVQERVDFELDIIKQKGFSSYFLVEADLVNAATRLGIYTNTRGSAAGSLVSFATGITNVDPLKYKLPFERFLNPLRPGIPDIDLDIADNRRDDLIDYLRQRYGEQSVAQIGTFGTMMARGSVRDVARALGYPYGIGDKISKLIPMGSQGFAMTIDRALKMEPELKKSYDDEKSTREIIDLAKKIEGCARHISVHAAGVVIAPTGHVDDFSPVQLDPKGGKIITQYDMYSGGRDGVVNLPKFDLLGLRNLNFIAETVDRVKKIRGIDVDMESIPLDDVKVFEMLSRGETMGVFQMAGSGMTKHIKELRPTKIEDLMAMVALYRPGPMEVIPEYIERKRNPNLVTYPDPRLKDDLEASYGLLVYQDDVLITSIRLAGYTWLDADKFRKAMGKKIPAEMEEQKEKFYKGCREYGGLVDAKIDELWKKIEPFAAYGFNKAHAASYGQLAYRTAWLKANYPAEYMSACMTAESGDIETVSDYISEAKHMGFKILPPDINESFSDFTVVVENGKVTKNIRFGLKNIKNFGEEIGKAIIAERKARGPFKTLEDFLERVQHKNLTKKSLEALIMTGAMDRFGERGNLMFNLETLLTFNRELAKFSSSTSDSLFGDFGDEAPAAKLTLEPAPPASMDQCLAWEKDLLGLFVTGHPLDKFKEHLDRSPFKIADMASGKHAGRKLEFLAIIDDVRELYTKKQDKMAFVRISDLSGAIDTVLFPETFQKCRDNLIKDTCVVVRGTVSNRNGENSILIDSVKQCKKEAPDIEENSNY